jgi:orotidine-5'-phosphate decarboxylase
MKKKIFIACDTNNINLAKKIIKHTRTKELNIGYKFGLEFFNSKNGRNFISKLNKNIIIWADLKLMDIPNTVASTINSLKDLKNIKYLTIHISGGLDMLIAAKNSTKKFNKNLKLLGVTILTSFSDNSLKNTGHTKTIKEIVKQQVRLAKKAKLDGIVCSGHEVKFIKNICRGMKIVTPGIRFDEDDKQDQSRVMSPKKAFQNGSNAIVIGRSITNGNIKNNVQKLIKSLN